MGVRAFGSSPSADAGTCRGGSTRQTPPECHSPGSSCDPGLRGDNCPGCVWKSGQTTRSRAARHQEPAQMRQGAGRGRGPATKDTGRPKSALARWRPVSTGDDSVGEEQSLQQMAWDSRTAARERKQLDPCATADPRRAPGRRTSRGTIRGRSRDLGQPRGSQIRHQSTSQERQINRISSKRKFFVSKDTIKKMIKRSTARKCRRSRAGRDSRTGVHTELLKPKHKMTITWTLKGAKALKSRFSKEETRRTMSSCKALSVAVGRGGRATARPKARARPPGDAQDGQAGLDSAAGRAG